MANTSTKQKKGDSKRQGGGGKWRFQRFLSSMRLLGAILAALILSLILFFRMTIAQTVIRSLGLAVIPAGLWVVIIAIVLWRHPGSLARRWNRWLGALLLTGALLGIMSLFHPAITIAGVSLSDPDITLGGWLGLSIAGKSYTWARLVGLALLGVISTSPKWSLNLAMGFASFIKGLLINLAIWIASALHIAIKKFIKWLISVLKRFRGALVRTPAPRGVEAEPSSAKGKEPCAEQTEMVSPSGSEAIAEAAEEPKQLQFSATTHELPPTEILDEAPEAGFAQADDHERAKLIEDALASYGIEAQVKQINPGPSVTQFGVEPGWSRKYKKVTLRDRDGKPKVDKEGNVKTRMEEVSKTRVRVERITSLANDLALALAVPDVRIEAPVPGKPLVGIEVPNVSSEIVTLRSVMESSKFQKAAAKSKLTLALGQGTGCEPMYGDLAKMPHLLIAGATGSGKTVCLNSIISCLLMQSSPKDVRFVLIDPKRVEMVNFSDVPHLITPVITELDKAVDALKRVSVEMDRRFDKFSSVRARNIEAYNQNPQVIEKMPYIVVVIDELADLMMNSSDVVEPLICRLAQLARATGIHLVVATQRPSVDVITGLIKTNFPTRISFAVVSSVDSRTILDTVGAEKLLGKGDMLYIPPEASKPKRIKGCYVSDGEIERLVGFWKEWASKHWPREHDTVARDFASLSVEDTDPFLEKARELVHESSNISISFLQRKLHIGYQRAARLMEELKEEGTIENSCHN